MKFFGVLSLVCCCCGIVVIEFVMVFLFMLMVFFGGVVGFDIFCYDWNVMFVFMMVVDLMF